VFEGGDAALLWGSFLGRQTAAVGAGLASLLAYSAAEYPAWLILLKPA
jgi:hypothetical protein